MSNASLISKSLDNPDKLTTSEQDSIAALAKSYPYFIPARYAAAISAYRQNPKAETIYHNRELYTANWLLFVELLYAGQEKPQEESAPIAVTETQEAAVEEEIAAEHTESPAAEIINNDPEPEKEEEQVTTEPAGAAPGEELIQPVFAEDYFRHQGVQVPDEIPEDMDRVKHPRETDPKSLMVVMSFAEWLMYYKSKKLKEAEEEQEKKALRTMWQKEKLAAAMEEEGDEIPEEVFKMAVDSISKEDGLVTESLAEIHLKQGRNDKAIDMYRKLSLRNPGKKVYFARKIEEILKNK